MEVNRTRSFHSNSDHTHAHHHSQDQHNSNSPVQPILVSLDSLLGYPDNSQTSSSSSSSTAMSASRTGRKPLQDPPPGTKEYTVQAEDSLEHIAVKFNMTPAELRRANKLHGASIVFPGQTLYVRRLDSSSSVNDSPIGSPTRLRSATTPIGGTNHSQSIGSASLTNSLASLTALFLSTPPPPQQRSQLDSVDSPSTSASTLTATATAPPDPSTTSKSSSSQQQQQQSGSQNESQTPTTVTTRDFPITTTTFETSTNAGTGAGTGAGAGAGAVLRTRSVVVPTDDLINDTLLQVHCLFVTEGWGVCPGWLVSTVREVKFIPDDVPLVQENGRQPYTLHFETMDIITPQVQEFPPNFGEISASRNNTINSSGSGGTPVNMPFFSSVSTSTYVTDLPRSESENSRGGGHMYLQLPVRVIFGQPITPLTVQPYWFAIAKDVVDATYSFFLRVVPDIMLDISSVIEPDPQPPITIPSSPLAQMLTPSNIIEAEIFSQLLRSLPRSVQLSDWHIIFSAKDNGCSLSAFYRAMNYEPVPNILLLKDKKGYVFGCFASKPWELSERFYGNGECALFQLKPELKVFHWNGSNNYFQMGKKDGLCMGGGDGAFGLWVDDMFDKGSSSPCPTFGNESIASAVDFTISDFEVWAVTCYD